MQVLKVVTERLSMVNPVLVALSPHRQNIMYRVHQKTNVHKFCGSLCRELNYSGVKFPNTIVYVRTYKDCIDIYMQLKKQWGLLSLNHNLIQIKLVFDW